MRYLIKVIGSKQSEFGMCDCTDNLYPSVVYSSCRQFSLSKIFDTLVYLTNICIIMIKLRLTKHIVYTYGKIKNLLLINLLVILIFVIFCCLCQCPALIFNILVVYILALRTSQITKMGPIIVNSKDTTKSKGIMAHIEDVIIPIISSDQRHQG